MANSFKLSTASSVCTAEVSVYTCPAATSTTIIGMTVANILTAQINVDVKLNNGGTKIFLVKNAPVPAGGSLVVVGGDQKVVMEPTDVMIVQANTADAADVAMSYLEIT